MRILFTGGIAAALLLSSLIPCAADADFSDVLDAHPEGVEAYCLYDLTHGRMLSEHNADVKLHTSTSAKVIAGLIFCEELKDRLDEEITVTEDMISPSSGYSMKLSAGEKIKIGDLLSGALCASYNDAYYALAYVVAGGHAEFCEKMNARARALGATDTNYVNPLGYPDNDAMTTTARDTLRIAEAAACNALYRERSGAVKLSVGATNKSDKRTFYNRNALIATTSYSQNYFMDNALGMSAGNSGDKGGWCVIGLAEDDGAELLSVVLGGRESEDGKKIYAYEATHELIDSAAKKFGTVSVISKGEVLAHAEVALTGISDSKVPCIAESAVDVYVPLSLADKVEIEAAVYSDALEAPVKAGTEVGYVRVVCNGETVGGCKLLLSEDRDANPVMAGIKSLGDYTRSRAFIATAVCFAVLMIVAFFVYRANPSRFSKKRNRR